MFYNTTEPIGILIYYATENITGSLFLTLFSLVLIIFMLFALFKIPLEYTAILIFPLLIVLMSYSSDFVSIGAIFILYLTFIVAKNIIFK